MLVTLDKTKEMTVDERRNRRFSEEFRRKQVSLIENNLTTMKEVSIKFEVKQDSVKGWLKKFGNKNYSKQVLVISAEEVNRIRDQDKEIKAIKQIVAEVHIRNVYLESVLSIIKKEYGSDWEKKMRL